MQPPFPPPAAKLTRLSKVISCVLGVLCLITAIWPWTRAFVALVPGRALPRIWMLVTSSFVTSNPLKALAEIAALLALARLVEPVCGSTELLRLVLVTAAASGAATFAGAYVAYLASPTRDGKLLYSEFSGFHGVIGGLLVAARQVMDGQDVKIGGAVSLEARYLPSLYVLAAGLAIAILGAWRSLPFLLVGPYAAWVYLRFFQPQPETTLRGDASDSFKFSGCFPAAAQAPLDALGGACSALFCLRHTAEAVAASSSGLDARALLLACPSGGALGGDGSDASRRRERGAKALEERLSLAKAVSASAAAAAAAPAPAAAAVAPDVDRMEAGGTS